MWERFSTSGLAGAYLDELLAAGMKARMEFRPRRVADPVPFLVDLVDESEEEAGRSWSCHAGNRRGGARP